MKTIEKIRLSNFKKFEQFEVDFHKEMNILIGDNEAGKSSILTALDLALSGSRSKVDSAGVESLLNIDSIVKFFREEPDQSAGCPPCSWKSTSATKATPNSTGRTTP